MTLKLFNYIRFPKIFNSWGLELVGGGTGPPQKSYFFNLRVRKNLKKHIFSENTDFFKYQFSGPLRSIKTYDTNFALRIE